jgi:predicted GNAT superfamily acetyltransferase
VTPRLREITAPGELAEVDALYRSVFGLPAGDNGLNQRLLVGLISNSGHVVGAYLGDTLVGFGLSFLARDRASGRLYQYSQTVAVAEHAQGRGVGRALKHAQRQAALDDGIDLMRWSFDPMHARNAHFNLDVLGARAGTLHPDLYGDAAPGRDAGERTDRLVVDWELSRPRPPTAELPAVSLQPGTSSDVDDRIAVAVPADWATYRRGRGSSVAADTRTRTIAAIPRALDRGLVAQSCRRVNDDLAVYVFGAGA